MSHKTIHLFSAPVNTGKTTRLLQWCGGCNGVAGILTPKVSGRRVFMDIGNHEQFNMEAAPGETDQLVIGKYVFSKASFNKAIAVVASALAADAPWIVIDEIGPLELQGKGFHDVLQQALTLPGNSQLVLVIRDTLVDQVIDHFELGKHNMVMFEEV